MNKMPEQGVDWDYFIESTAKLLDKNNQGPFTREEYRQQVVRGRAALSLMKINQV